MLFAAELPEARDGRLRQEGTSAAEATLGSRNRWLGRVRVTIIA
jgi:hypothetical protein